MKLSSTHVILLAAVLLVFGGHRFFFDTLSLSDLLGKQGGATANIMINLFDFDTSLTRYDVSRLKDKAEYWQEKRNEINAMQDPVQRQTGKENLLSEMLEDPSIKKIWDKTFRLGGDTFFDVIQAISVF